MENTWDKRYSSAEYAYGKEPNEYLMQELGKLNPGRILFPGEGEGRNAVFAAESGWEVHAFDSSTEGRRKALLLAEEKGVKIDYTIADIGKIDLPKNEFDVIALIYIHLPPEERKNAHEKFVRSLKKDGVIIMEAFSKSQLENSSGGPKDIGILYSIADLRDDFRELKILEISECVINLDEGEFHKGRADVIRLKAVL